MQVAAYTHKKTIYSQWQYIAHTEIVLYVWKMTWLEVKEKKFNWFTLEL